MKIAFVYNEKKSSSIDEAEFDTPEVIDEIYTALKSNGSEVTKIEMTQDGTWIDELITTSPDLVFNTAEGYAGVGREAYAPTVFEQLKIRYVGSGPYTCYLTLDKYLTKKVVENKGVRTPESYFVSSENEVSLIADELIYPVFVKPNFEGSSKGITKESRCLNKKSYIKYATQCLKMFPEGILVERFIEGKDITVPYVNGIGNSGILDPVEYVGIEQDGITIYDYDLKNTDDSQVGIRIPADIPVEAKELLASQMKLVIAALGTHDMARADFRVTPQGEVFFIELNALPSLQSDAGLFQATRLCNLDYNQTILSIVQSAIDRYQIPGSRLRKVRALKQRKPNVALVYNMKRKNPGDKGYELEAEFDSPTTIEAIAQAIRENKHDLKLIEADRNLSHNLTNNNIDVVFNIAEGLHKQSREAQVPALCDLLGIEHTGSDAACLSITLNKSLSTKLVATEGLLAPRSKIFDRYAKNYKHDLLYPLILKPNLEGTSKGIYNNSVVKNESEFIERLHESFERSHGPIIAEEYIEGREITVGIWGQTHPNIIGISEIVFKDVDNPYPIYSFEAKQEENPLDNKIFRVESPPALTKKLERKIAKVAKEIFLITGCRDVARIDFKITPKDEVYFIEVNPLPGLSPGFSDLTIIAEKNGVSYNNLIGKILKPAIKRWRQKDIR